MKSEKILEAMGNIDDDMIIEAESVKFVPKLRKRFLMPLAACILLSFLIGIGHFLKEQNNPQIIMPSTMADAPMGMRKILNYNGMRYKFLGNGASIELENIELGEELGDIIYDLTKDPKSYANKDFSASFAVGGKIYSLEGYDPNFRVAVLMGENTYLCESVDQLKGEDIDIKKYFETAQLLSLTKEIEVYDHVGKNLLTTFDSKESMEILNGVSSSVAAKLKIEDYEEIGKMQTQGKSFLLRCKLNDGTYFEFYLIPQLGIAMIGDNRYKVPQASQQTYLGLFESLKQEPIPMQ